MNFSSEANTEAPSAVRFTMPKSARLRHRTLVNQLFEKGENIYVYPLRGTWRMLDERELAESFRTEGPEGIGPVQLLVTIPKKKRKHAVDRVRMRRLVKEAFRKHRHRFVDLADRTPEWRTLSIALVYIADKNLDYKTVERKMGMLLKKLFSSLDKGDESGKGDGEG